MRLAGYAAGVAAGTLLGLVVDERLPVGTSEVDIVVPGREPPLADSLRELGWPVTTFPGEGPSGAVTVICVAVDRSRVAELTGTVKRLAPGAFWTVQPLGAVHASEVPDGFAQARA